jgi:hypothetical protein
MVSAMVESAYAIGVTLAGIARASHDDHKALIEASTEFRHCFFAVRMGIRLKMSLRAGAVPRPQAEVIRSEAAEREAPERDHPERDPPERDREGDRESVSMPAFLKSIGVVVRAAETRGEDLPADAVPALSQLRSLLAEAGGVADRPPPAAPARPSGITVLAQRRSAPPVRSRLLGSAAAPPRGPPRPRSG